MTTNIKSRAENHRMVEILATFLARLDALVRSRAEPLHLFLSIPQMVYFEAIGTCRVLDGFAARSFISLEHALQHRYHGRVIPRDLRDLAGEQDLRNAFRLSEAAAGSAFPFQFCTCS